jgi:hypothetical protein
MIQKSNPILFSNPSPEKIPPHFHSYKWWDEKGEIAICKMKMRAVFWRHFSKNCRWKSLVQFTGVIHKSRAFLEWSEVYSFSSNPEGKWKNCQHILKFLLLIFGSETSKQVKWARNFRVDYTIFFNLLIWQVKPAFVLFT